MRLLIATAELCDKLCTLSVKSEENHRDIVQLHQCFISVQYRQFRGLLSLKRFSQMNFRQCPENMICTLPRVALSQM